MPKLPPGFIADLKTAQEVCDEYGRGVVVLWQDGVVGLGYKTNLVGWYRGKRVETVDRGVPFLYVSYRHEKHPEPLGWSPALTAKKDLGTEDDEQWFPVTSDVWKTHGA